MKEYKQAQALVFVDTRQGDSVNRSERISENHPWACRAGSGGAGMAGLCTKRVRPGINKRRVVSGRAVDHTDGGGSMISDRPKEKNRKVEEMKMIKWREKGGRLGGEGGGGLGGIR